MIEFLNKNVCNHTVKIWNLKSPFPTMWVRQIKTASTTRFLLGKVFSGCCWFQNKIRCVQLCKNCIFIELNYIIVNILMDTMQTIFLQYSKISFKNVFSSRKIIFLFWFALIWLAIKKIIPLCFRYVQTNFLILNGFLILFSPICYKLKHCNKPK